MPTTWNSLGKCGGSVTRTRHGAPFKDLRTIIIHLRASRAFPGAWRGVARGGANPFSQIKNASAIPTEVFGLKKGEIGAVNDFIGLVPRAWDYCRCANRSRNKRARRVPRLTDRLRFKRFAEFLGYVHQAGGAC